MTLPATTRNMGEMLSTIHTAEKAENRRFLLTILYNIKFVARQNCAIHVHSDTDSNYHQQLKLHSEDGPKLLEWLKKKRGKYTSHEIQNEMLKPMAS